MMFLKLMACGAAVLLFQIVWMVSLYLQNTCVKHPCGLAKDQKRLLFIHEHVAKLHAALRMVVSLGMHKVLLPNNLRSLIFGSASDPMWRCLAEVPAIYG